MNKMFFALLATITILPGCFGLFKKDEAKIEQTSANSAEEIAPISDSSDMNEDSEEAQSEEYESDEK